MFFRSFAIFRDSGLHGFMKKDLSFGVVYKLHVCRFTNRCYTQLSVVPGPASVQCAWASACQQIPRVRVTLWINLPCHTVWYGTTEQISTEWYTTNKRYEQSTKKLRVIPFCKMVIQQTANVNLLMMPAVYPQMMDMCNHAPNAFLQQLHVYKQYESSQRQTTARILIQLSLIHACIALCDKILPQKVHCSQKQCLLCNSSFYMCSTCTRIF